MNRREVLGSLALAASAWPFPAQAQNNASRVIGFLRSTPLAGFEQLTRQFQEGLRQIGLIEDRDVAVAYRYADDHVDRLTEMAAELMRLPVAVIVGDSLAMRAVRQVADHTPLVFATGADPVGSGFVTSLNRPGGNTTGVTFFAGELGAKRFELLRQLMPNAKVIAALGVRDNPTSAMELKDIADAAQRIGQTVVVLEIADDRDLQQAFTTIAERGASALLVGAGTFLNSRKLVVVEMASRLALPAIYTQRSFVDLGGLISYGANVGDAYRQVGVYAGRIIKGEKAGSLPVVQATRFELFINLKTAAALRLEIPAAILAQADEVIE